MKSGLTINLKYFSRSLKQNGIACVCREERCDTETPVSIYLKLSRGSKNSFLLESAEGGIRWGRYSFISAAAKYVLEGGADYFSVNGRRRKTRDAFGQLRNFIKRFTFPSGVPGLPFAGGGVGYFSYDIAGEWEDIHLPHGKQEAYFRFMLPETVVAVDHLKQTMKIISWAYDSEKIPAAKLFSAARRRADAVLKKIEKATVFPAQKTARRTPFKCSVTKKTFERQVQRARKYIIDGDCIQTVLSRYWTAKAAPPPVEVYRSLRMINPSPYMYLLQFGNFAIAGSSPEILVRKTGREAVLRPIAGTRKRGAGPEEDRRLADELLADAKERAEHIMLVDLARNDLGRVCTSGSVSVRELMSVEKFSHVIHMTSEVTGTLSRADDSFSLFKASFPAGTVSGAPKVRAMQIISELENSRRGPYAGAVGYFSFNGDMDFAIAIRTIFFKGASARIQAGAGLVYDSVPENEYLETGNKAAALMKAVEAAGRK